ncbi:hypothetical protein BFJ63_vAg18418 [Fusarium oxysporum f. sp. narcissi]|uniref:Uncharacterized protein n=1 Tax=Fusarium oxysporum f. sp. narcissi TaxID=451672 RepID=A0A4Q2V1Q0_FUSOX|nr:hypothetical protein BFJ63_vAg18418 [Fusarium oxysporum f. sp. narcissi]
MFPRTNLGQIITLFIFALIAPVYSLDCRSIAISSVHSFNIPKRDNCNLYCETGQMTRDFSSKLVVNDPCQGDDGFSTFVTDIRSMPCVTGCGEAQTCRCSVRTTAFRVHKDNQYRPDTGLVSCKLADYVARVTKRPFVAPGQSGTGYYSLGFVSNDDVHCAHQ